DIKSFPWWDEFIKQKEKGWWGPSDKDVIKKFKELILEVNGKQPFFAVMFTVDFHANLSNFMDNPFFDTDEEIIASTINNFNEFIEWFEKQDFYENTSLVILADHKKMGNKIKNPKEKLYNAFFNVPKELEEGLNLDRTFNQVDIAPTLLELAGVKLKERQYGVGVSLFSNKKTLVER
ncbi:MAG: sulfatase-like hydrolase/transferase, partial [Alphaproteobacteria bacterium]|nr:sulfatase-like hydrolase/transferase [Alphaproteobacteria bacterium]